MLFQLLRSLLVLTGTIFGVAVGYAVVEEYPGIAEIENPQLAVGALLGFIGYLFCSIFGRELQNWLEKQLNETNAYSLAWGAFGIFLGLISANLLFVPVYILIFNGYSKTSFNNGYINGLIPFLILIIPTIFSLFFAYIGMKIILRYRRYNSKLNISKASTKAKVVDTSAMIDGRFSDLFRLGFIEGNIIIPRFVINELQFLSNSENEFKKSRGIKGLETFQQLKIDFPDTVIVTEDNYPEVNEIDTKFIKLAIEFEATIITQDYNLKKIAELEQATVLNVNDLANAIKPIFVIGESIEVKIMKKGKESFQGVGFLSDGTMIVIEDGGDHVGETLPMRVSNILHTGAGRMIFCRINDKK